MITFIWRLPLKVKINRSELNTLLFVGIVLLLRLASGPTANLSFVVIAVYATLGRSQAIKALALCWLFTMISPGIAPSASLGAVGRYLVFLGAFVGVFLKSGVMSGALKISSVVLSTIALGLLILLHSITLSELPAVSILKILSWVLVTGTLFSAWKGLDGVEREELTEQLFKALTTVMIVSIPLFFLSLGYIRNGTGFQGILGHPQAFGPTMALLTVFYASRLFSEGRPSWQNLALFATGFVFVIASEARTAGLAVVIALSVAMFATPMLSKRRMLDIFPALKSKRLFVALIISFCLAILFSSQIQEQINSFISKSGRAGTELSVTEAYDISRGGLIDKMYSNIIERPIAGIGFGVASEPSEMVIQRDPIFGLPIGAAIEKGVMPLAVIEELGVVIASFVFLWLFLCIRRAARKGFTTTAIILTCLLLNFGENIFFSPGGMGMLILILFTWAGTSAADGHCDKLVRSGNK